MLPSSQNPRTVAAGSLISLVVLATLYLASLLGSGSQLGGPVIVLRDSSPGTRVEFPSFADYLGAVQQRLLYAGKKYLRICFATFALVGPIKNGGIATADTALAEALTADGHQVTVLYMHGAGVQIKTIEHWVEHYKKKLITLVPLPAEEMRYSPSAPSSYITKSFRAYQWLRERDGEFDIIHFHEWHGPGYFTTLAKRQGLAFQNTVLWTVIHCPAVFYLQGNFAYLTTWNNFASDYLERMQVLWSDLVVSPSAFMLKWVQQHGWTLPAHVFVQHNLLSNEILHWARNGLPGAASGGGGGSIVGPAAPLPEVIQVEEFVFFARLEVLKGIYEFCDAIDLLTPDVLAGKLRRFDVTFLGNPNMGDTDAVKFIQGRARGDRSKPGWAITPKIYTDRIQPEAIEYMRGRLGRVSVLASLVENSPYTVLESLTLGIPFIASNVGGIPELIRPEDRTRVLFTPNARSLAERMRAVLVDGLRPARGTSDPFRVREEWLDFHRLVSVGLHQVPRSALSAVTAPLPRSAELSPITAHPLVSVVVVTHDRGDLLLKTLESLMAQTYTHFEVLLVDDGSTQPRHVEVLSLVERFFSTAQPEVPFRLVRQANLYPGAARNHGARLARGEYVMFLDDDDLAKPTWMSTMVSVALRTGADVVTCMADFFHGEGTPVPGQTPDLRWIPVGPAVDLGLYHNVFGAYSALVRRASFFAIGGFTEDFGTTYEDYEFFATAVLKGFQLELVPEPLLWYRQNPNTHLMKSTNRFLNRLRSLRAYEKAVNPLLRQLIAMVYGTGMDAGE